MREILRHLTSKEIATLPDQDLQRAILNAMAERARDRTAGMANLHQPAAEIVNHAASIEGIQAQERQELGKLLERNFRRAFKALDEMGLIEPAPGPNGANGFVLLTHEGKAAAAETLDFQLVRARNRLHREMLHPKLRGKPYEDFANGHPNSAIQEAYKIVDIEVGTAAQAPNAFGVNLLQAFDHDKGPLTDFTENEPTRKALARLFAGAMGRFRNSSTHTHRAFPDLNEAIEELMVASRLLRFLDEPNRR